MHMLQSLFYLTTVTAASGNRYTVLSAAIVEELELIYILEY